MRFLLYVLSTAALIFATSLSWAGIEADSCLEKGVFEQISCLSDLAAEKGDASVCTEATNEGVEYQCYAVAAEKLGDWNTCLEIPAQSKEHIEIRDLCISDVAEKTADPDLCEEITTANFKDSCYLKVFRKTGDASLCKKITDAGTKSMCTGEPVYVK